MSRTFRKNGSHSRYWLKHPKTKQRVKAEASGAEQIKEEGFNPRPRGVANSKYNLHVPNAWDDRPVAAMEELPKSGRPLWREYDRNDWESWRRFDRDWDEWMKNHYKKSADARQKVVLVRRLREFKSRHQLQLCCLR